MKLSGVVFEPDGTVTELELIFGVGKERFVKSVK